MKYQEMIPDKCKYGCIELLKIGFNPCSKSKRGLIESLPVYFDAIKMIQRGTHPDDSKYPENVRDMTRLFDLIKNEKDKLESKSIFFYGRIKEHLEMLDTE